MFIIHIGNEIMEQSDNGKYNSVEVAKYIIAYWNEKGSNINMTKTQKLLYIAYGIWYAVKDERLVDEHPQVWPFGPVFPITREKLLNRDFATISFNDVVDEELKNDIEIASLMKIIYKSQFGSWAANKLSAWSHQDGSPWEEKTSLPGFAWGEIMDDNRIKLYFKEVVLKK